MSKTFFSKKRAEEFADELVAQGFEKVEIWGWMDAFNQHSYTVKWY